MCIHLTLSQYEVKTDRNARRNSDFTIWRLQYFSQ